MKRFNSIVTIAIIMMYVNVCRAGAAPPFEYLTRDNIISVTESSVYSSNRSAEELVNGSGMNYNNWTHARSGTALSMWSSVLHAAQKPNPVPGVGPFSTWVSVEFDRIYTLTDMWVWNYNLWETVSERCIKKVRIDYSADGVIWKHLKNGNSDYYTLTRAPGRGALERTDEINLMGVQAKFITLTAAPLPEGTYGATDVSGLSEIVFGISSMPREFVEVYPETLNLPEYSDCLGVYDSEVYSYSREMVCRELTYDVSDLKNNSVQFLARCADSLEELHRTAFTPIYQDDPYTSIDRKGRHFQVRYYIFGRNDAYPPVVSNVSWEACIPNGTAVNQSPPEDAAGLLTAEGNIYNSGFETVDSVDGTAARGWDYVLNYSVGADTVGQVRRVYDPTAPEGDHVLHISTRGRTRGGAVEVGASQSFSMNGELGAVVSFWIKGEDIKNHQDGYSGARVNYYVTDTEGKETPFIADGFGQGFGMEWGGDSSNFGWVKISNFISSDKPMSEITVVPCLYTVGQGMMWVDDFSIKSILDFGHDDGGRSFYEANDGAFPISIYLLPEHDRGQQSYIPMLAELGFNMTIWRSGITSYDLGVLDYLDQYGMKDIIRFQESEAISALSYELDQHPATWGYYISDEPGDSRQMPHSLFDVEERSNFLVNSGYEKPVMVVDNGKSVALNFLPYVDYYGWDIYQNPEIITDSILDYRKILGAVSCNTILPAYWDYYVEHCNNPNGHKAAAFGALINNTRGIGGFRFGGVGFDNYVKAVERVHYLAKPLVEGWGTELSIIAESGGVVGRAIWYDRNVDGEPELYLILAEVANRDAECTVTIKDLPEDMEAFSVYGEANYSSDGDVFTISLAPFGTDVIRIISESDLLLHR